METRSLTQRVRAECDGDFDLRLLGQGWDRPLHDEARALRIQGRRVALVRQVELACHGTPWIFARSIIPQRTLRMNRRLNALGTRPLADLLFRDPEVRRQRLEVGSLCPGQALYHLATEDRGPPAPRVWCRRSVYLMRAQPLLVTEVFLPPIPEDGR